MLKIYRSRRGNTLALVVFLLACILLLLAMFCFRFSRIFSINHEGCTAIEAAALAAATSMSRVVIDDEDLGLISISDYPPNRKGTRAGDNFFMPVKGINTVLATIRLDMIIADQLNDNIMRICAVNDYEHAMRAKDLLNKELKQCLEPGSSATDIDGNTVSPWEEAVAAFKRNVGRNDWKLQENSLVLTLGCQQGLATNMPLPAPYKYSFITDDKQVNGFYKAFTNIKYKDKDFVFAATSNTSALCDTKDFAASIPGLPYVIPSVVHCQATYTTDGNVGKHKLTSAACAYPVCIVDRAPAAGGLLITFPQEVPKQVSDLKTLLTSSQIVESPTDEICTSTIDDAPPMRTVACSLPELKSFHPPLGQVLRVATYDWIRRGGPNINIDQVFNALSFPFSTAKKSSAISFQFTNDSSIRTEVIPISPTVTLPVSHKQWGAVSGLVIDNGSVSAFDVFVKDFVHQPGRRKGGIHGGEPLALSGPEEPDDGGKARGIDDPAVSVLAFKRGPGAGAERPTYSERNIAVEIRLRQR